ncbi:MAG: hypothetical protein AB1416_07390 [Actinomycetota bacterium]
MRVILRLTLVRAWRRAAALGLAFLLFELLVGMSYASVDENELRRLVESLPPAIRAFAAGSDIASPWGYVGTGFLHPVALSIQATLVVSVAAMAARDVEDGVAEVILARPLARWRWLAAQGLALLVLLAGVATAGFAGSAIAVAAVDDLASVSFRGLALAVATGALLQLTAAAVTMVAAALSRTAGRAVGWGAGFVLVSYAINYLAQLWTPIERLGWLSVFDRFRPAGILRDVAVPGVDVLVLAGVAVVAAVAALWLTDRREVAP